MSMIPHHNPARFYQISLSVTLLILALIAGLIFSLPNQPLTVCIDHDGFYPPTAKVWRRLIDKLSSHPGVSVMTYSESPQQCMNADILLVVHYYRPMDIRSRLNKKNVLFLIESPAWQKYHRINDQAYLYDTVITHSPTEAREKKYIWMPIPYHNSFEPRKFNGKLQKKSVLTTLISTNLYFDKNGHDYEPRRKTVRWFLENAPDDILLYGNYWDKIKQDLSPSGQQAFHRRYKGRIADKRDALMTARFTFAYENTIREGYISEKIFDAIYAGSVPVYLGAPDISDFVPSDCFINRNDFPSDQALYTFLKKMPDQKYQEYQNCIWTYIQHPNPLFDPETASDKLLKILLPFPPLIERLLIQLKGYVA